MSPVLEAGARALQQRFGAEVLCAVASVDGDVRGLWPRERELVAAAVPGRLREFAAGRVHARALLARLGFEPAPLLAHGDRAPSWPAGAIGAIAHDARLCVVAVTRTGAYSALGVDVEPDEPLEARLWSTLFVRRELESLAERPRSERGRVARLLFSAKECVYKCTRAVVGRPLGFHDLEIEPDLLGGRFRAHLLRRSPADVAFSGFHFTCAGSVLTGMALTAQAGACP